MGGRRGGSKGEGRRGGIVGRAVGERGEGEGTEGEEGGGGEEGGERVHRGWGRGVSFAIAGGTRVARITRLGEEGGGGGGEVGGVYAATRKWSVPAQNVRFRLRPRCSRRSRAR